MTTAISISCTIFFISTQIFGLHIAKSEFSVSRNTTEHESLWRADRSKRSIQDTLPYQLKITIQYEVDKHADLILSKQMVTLANQHLPVIKHQYGLAPNVMADIGEFVMYHDTANCVALVYFEKFNALFGVFGMNYHIHGVPFAFDEHGEYQFGIVGEPYVSKNNYQFSHIHPENVLPPPFDTDAWEDYLRASNYIPHGIKRPATSDSGPSTKRQHTEFGGSSDEEVANINRNIPIPPKLIFERYYMESLVFVTQDLVELFKINFGEDYIAAIVRYHIIYFNAVQLILGKLGKPSVQLFINIAKIIIEDHTRPFDFITNEKFQFTDIVNKVPQYLQLHLDEYVADSFDYIFIHTSRTVMDDTIELNGLTKHGEDMYQAKKNGIFYNAIPITVMKFEYYYVNYAATVHEIGRILNMEITPKESGLKSTGQCHDIMQRGGPKCGDCLQWSDDNQKQFRDFFRYNRNRCFLLNQPRSIRPPGVSRFVSPHRQCQCFGYDSNTLYSNNLPRKSVTIKGCSKPLMCRKITGTESIYEPTISPFDGTECGYNRVCWNGRCEKLPVILSTFPVPPNGSN